MCPGPARQGRWAPVTSACGARLKAGQQTQSRNLFSQWDLTFLMVFLMALRNVNDYSKNSWDQVSCHPNHGWDALQAGFGYKRCVGVWVLFTQSRLTLSNPVDCSPPGSSVHGSLQARILEWVSVPSSRGSSRPRDRTQVSCMAGRFSTI